MGVSSSPLILVNAFVKVPSLSLFPTQLKTPHLFPPESIPHYRTPVSLSKSRVSRITAMGDGGGTLGLAGYVMDSLRTSPATWQSSVASNLVIFAVGSPLLLSGLTVQGIASAFLLGVLTWRAFGGSGFLLVAVYFVLGTAATKLKIAQKEAQGVAEKRKGRRGPGSVIGSSAAGCVCAVLSISGAGGAAFTDLWRLGFVANFCTKLSDTIASEIGKASGKTTYLVTTLKVVPRGTEGAISLEGTLAGIIASMILASVGYFMGEVNYPQAVICVIASQIANLGESLIGASFQEKEGFQWLNNDIVNIMNISIGSILAMLLQGILFKEAAL